MNEALHLCRALQAAFLLGCNSIWCLPFELAIVLNSLLILPAVLLTALQHCLQAEPVELAACAQAAARIRLWLFAVSPLAGAPPAELLRGTPACVLLHTWIPAMVGQVAPLSMLAAVQLAWRADFLALHEAGRPPRPERGATWTTFHACTLLLVMSCGFWAAAEAAAVRYY
jgi:hypothetical protein